MGVDLRGAGSSFRFNWSGWRHVLTMAHVYGWQPAGTQFNVGMYRCLEEVHAETEGEEIDREELERELALSVSSWEGGYGSNDCQIVTAQDAANIAVALELALDDVPDVNVLASKTETFPLANGEYVECIPSGVEVNCFEWFSGPDGKQYLREFIEFCKTGEFSIW